MVWQDFMLMTITSMIQILVSLQKHFTLSNNAMRKENNIQNHCSKCNHKWTTTDESLALWVTMHFWCDKCKASEILEWAKDDMFAKYISLINK
jgi:predicted  nucleic acid-binding Zn ribbon protein